MQDSNTRRNLQRLGLALLAVSSSGCVSLSRDAPPLAKVAPDWHATLPHAGKTTQLVKWWDGFRDPALTTLQRNAESDSPTLASAGASIEKARATLASSRSGLLPSLTGSGSVTRSGQAGSSSNEVAASTDKSGGLDASWEVDLFGKTREQAKAAANRVTEEADDWHQARVSLAAEVADDYVQYRACRKLETVYRQELLSQRDTIKATESSEASGLTATSDLALAKAGAASSSSTLKAQQADCEILIKSLAELVGGDETLVRRTLRAGPSTIPVPSTFAVTSLPADALRQRPDIAALEREIAASAADIGAAKADFYPSLSLGGSLTIDQSSLTGASRPWSFGPSLSIPLFDGGQRKSSLKGAYADYDIALANYQSGIRSAVNEVETALVHVDSTRKQIGDAASAAKSYRTYFNAIDQNWKAGGASLLDREEARRSAQSAEISLIELRRDSVRYWIALYKALGGGWGDKAVGASNQTASVAKGMSQ
jgi:NodT family efflux transporter outer membrane factor (OMF) lipoprotein